MRTINLLPTICLALYALVPAAAAPLEMSKVMPLPGLGAVTLGLISPTSLPNVNVPNAPVPGVPGRRSYHQSANIHPREYHSADFSAAPNTTTPAAPVASKRTLDTRSSKHKPHPKTPASDLVSRADHKSEQHSAGSSKHKPHPKTPASDLVSRADHKSEQHAADPGSPQAAAGQLASALKAAGGAPKQLSGVTNAAPIAIPETPVTSADTSAADSAVQAKAEKKPQHADEPTAAPGSNPDAYPHSDGYDYSGAAPASAGPAPTKRHSMVLDTDPVLPPTDMEGKDPAMGVLNVDSNRKPEDVPAPKDVPEKAQKDATKKAQDVPVDAPKDTQDVPVDASKDTQDVPADATKDTQDVPADATKDAAKEEGAPEEEVAHAPVASAA